MQSPTRPLGAFLSLISLSAGCAVLSSETLMAAPDPIDRSVQPMPGIPGRNTPMKNYFPLQQGYWWKYQATTPQGTTYSYTMRALGQKKQPDGSYLDLVETQLPRSRFYTWFNRMNKGVILRHSTLAEGDRAKLVYQPAQIFMKNPLFSGESWQWQGKGGDGSTIQETATIGEEETVVVPAGKFRAIKVVVTTKISQGDATVVPPLTETRWLAESVGVVKLIVSSPGYQTTSELVNYSFK